MNCKGITYSLRQRSTGIRAKLLFTILTESLSDQPDVFVSLGIRHC